MVLRLLVAKQGTNERVGVAMAAAKRKRRMRFILNQEDACVSVCRRALRFPTLNRRRKQPSETFTRELPILANHTLLDHHLSLP